MEKMEIIKKEIMNNIMEKINYKGYIRQNERINEVKRRERNIERK